MKQSKSIPKILLSFRYGTASNFSLFKSDYIKLYVDTIKPVVQRLDKTRSYVTSSPSNGLESEREGYVAINPYDSKYGDGEMGFLNYFINKIAQA
jgi:beta-mannosidase